MKFINYGSPFVCSETLPPTIHADQHPDRLGRQVSATWDINPVVPRRSVSQPTPAPAGAYTYHTPRSSYHSAFIDHSTRSPAKYSNYDFVPPASSLSTISEVERPTPYENHTLPQELKGATPVTFQPKYENVEAAKRSRSGSIHVDVYENVLFNGEQLAGAVKNPARASERIYENLQ